MKQPRLAIALGLFVLMWLEPLRTGLERDMALHMSVQLPLLIGLGLLIASALSGWEPCFLAEADWLGIPGLVLVAFVTSFWMLPRMLDWSLADPLVDLVKFLSMTLLAGLPLGLSWRRMPGLGRAFVWTNFVPKLGAVGGLYLAAPVRLCAFYRLDQQTVAGWTLIALTTVLALATLVVALVGWPAALCPRRSQPEWQERGKLGRMNPSGLSAVSWY
jgi:hypothetical protein